MYRFLKIFLVVGVFLAMAGGGNALALDDTHHVSIAPNLKGDLMIFPAYFTGGAGANTWSTKLTVINTSNTLSTVAKVVIRSKGRSQELRDFMIFLSPNDVWTGTLYSGPDPADPTLSGWPWLESTDDSCLTDATPTWASATNPFETYLNEACTGDVNTLGYVEVIGGPTWTLPKTAAGVVDKDDIYTAYQNWLAAPGAANADWPKNILTGLEEITDGGTGRYALNATVLKNYDWDINTPLDVLTETLIGFPGESDNNLIEVEAALSKNEIAVPYYAGSEGHLFSLFTFPTKEAGFPCNISDVHGPYFLQNTHSPAYTLTAYNLTEQSVSVDPTIISPPLPETTLRFVDEVNFLPITSLSSAVASFTEGWFRIVLQNSATGGFAADGLTAVQYYNSAPVIGSYMRYDTDGRAGWLYTAHSEGDVYVTPDLGFRDLDLQYHYWGQADK